MYVDWYVSCCRLLFNGCKWIAHPKDKDSTPFELLKNHIPRQTFTVDR
jgi:hypothetical protein